jgi:LPS export ABC transporter protein LptC
MRAERAALVLLLAFALAACSSRAPDAAPAATARPLDAPSATTVPVHVSGQGDASNPAVMTYSKQNRKIYTIRALSFEGDAVGTNGTGVFDRPHITFVDRTGSITIADAPKATAKQRDNSLDMTGGVHARTAEGGILTCDDLRYDAHSERLHGEGHVVLTSPNGLRLTGDHLDGDVRLHDVTVSSGARR